MSSIVFCLLLSCSRWLPFSLLCRLAIFCMVVLLISSLYLVASLCSVWSTYCLSFLLYVRPISTFVSVCILQCHFFVLFLISEHGILSCSFRPNIFLSIALWAVLSLLVNCLSRDHVWQPCKPFPSTPCVTYTAVSRCVLRARAFPWCKITLFRDDGPCEEKFVRWLVGWLFNVQATCSCISGTDLLK